jgi:hypothetical protein
VLKVRSCFMRWLKMEAVRRGLFLYQVIEEVAAGGCSGKTPWTRGSGRQVERG